VKRAGAAAALTVATWLAPFGAVADPPEWAQAGRPAPPPEFLQPTLDAGLAPYRTSGAHGRLEGCAPPIVAALAAQWMRAFQAREPGVRVELSPPYLPPQGALNPRLRDFLEGHLDFAFLTREMAASDVAQFRRVHGFDPLLLPVSGGSFRHFGFVDAVAVVVHRNNPLQGLSLAQLDAIFSRTRHRGQAAPAVTWGELGLPEWTGRPVHVVGTGAWVGEESARATFFRERVMDGAAQRGEWRDDGRPPDAGDAVVTEAVAADPLAIGFTAMGHLTPGVRAIAIAVQPDSPLIEPSYENVARATYPLSRVFYLALARKPGHTLRPALEAWTRFLVSKDGQALVLAQGVFLPLREFQASQALEKLSQFSGGVQPGFGFAP